MNVRFGERKDVPQLLELIHELAVYEHAAEEVSIDVETLIQDGFGANPIFEFLVAEEHGNVLGIALFYTKYSTWKGACIHLEDLVVRETHRRKGVGRELFERLKDEAEKRKVKRLEWQVLDWNTPAIQFYEKQNAEFDHEWINCKLAYP